MREIKFRLFSKVAQSIIEWEQVKEKPHLIWDGRYIEMQFTGLKDSKGVEIYEGDVVLFNIDFGYGMQPVTAEIIFEDAGFKARSGAGTDFLKGLPACEVIGTIHENPELLEATK